jgi:ribosomal protein L11 methyltransferase
MEYTRLTFDLREHKNLFEALTAELGMLGFESFEEKENDLLAYIQTDDWDEELLNESFVLQSSNIAYQAEDVKMENWNQTWEDNFEPIYVDDEIYVRAPFHPQADYKYEILIEPKMSFGTGHHETTHLILSQLLRMNLESKSVLDMGCGTGILGIFASIKGAADVDAIDIDEWCYENTKENAQRNGVENLRAFKGDVGSIPAKQYDVLIANINRNILLNDMAKYTQHVKNQGILVLSGFYQEDFTTIDQKCRSLGYTLKDKNMKNNWLALSYVLNK